MNVVHIYNTTTYKIEKFQMIASEKQVWSGNISAGEKKEMKFVVSKDGAIRIEYLCQGRKIDSGNMGYVTSHSNANYNIQLYCDHVKLQNNK